MIRYTFLLLFFLVIISPAYSGENVDTSCVNKNKSLNSCLLEAATRSMFNKDYPKAKSIFESNILSTDPQAQHGLAVIYLEGLGVNRNISKAHDLLIKSASSHADIAPASQFLLGYIYTGQFGAYQNADKSLYWYEKSASGGFTPSQTILATMYFQGDGVTQNYQKAFDWAETSALNGDPHGQLILVELYGRGLGVTKSYARSYFWSLIAANSNDPFSVTKGSQLSAKLELLLTKEEITQVQEDAGQWSAKSQASTNFNEKYP